MIGGPETVEVKEPKAGEPDFPTLTVTWQGEGADQTFSWNVEGVIPTLNMVGALTCTINGLTAKADAQVSCIRTEESCPGLVIRFHQSLDKKEHWSRVWMNPGKYPKDALIGFLETIKSLLVANNIMKQQQAAIAQAQSPILGADGRPLTRPKH